MTVHTHGEDEEFIEVEFDYLDAFNQAQDYLGKIQYRAVMPKDTLTFVMARMNGVKIVVFPNDHPPPHFHVVKNDESAAFSIETGERLEGSKGLKGKDKQIRRFWHYGRYEILEHWNKLRPDDRPHQRMTAPDFWPEREAIEKKYIFTSDQLNDWKS